jgi:hypothetical protein
MTNEQISLTINILKEKAESLVNTMNQKFYYDNEMRAFYNREVKEIEDTVTQLQTMLKA